MCKRTENAFREGYRAGYDQGENDATSYEWGCGVKHRETRRREQDDAWKDSDANRPLSPDVDYEI